MIVDAHLFHAFRIFFQGEMEIKSSVQYLVEEWIRRRMDTSFLARRQVIFEITVFKFL